MQMMKTRLDPEALFISVDEAKKHARVSTSADDNLIKTYIRTATAIAEARTGREFLPTGVRVPLFGWANELVIPASPLRQKVKFAYLNTAGALVEVSDTLWSVTQVNEDTIFLTDLDSPELSESPTAMFKVFIDFEIGFDDPTVSGSGETASLAPDEMDYHLVRLLVAHFYENREIATVGTLVQNIPMGAQAIIDMRRIYR